MNNNNVLIKYLIILSKVSTSIVVLSLNPLQKVHKILVAIRCAVLLDLAKEPEHFDPIPIQLCPLILMTHAETKNYFRIKQ